MHEPSTAHAVPHAHAGTLARWKAAVRRSPLGPVLRPVYRTLRAWDSVGFAVGVLLAVGALVAAIADALNVAVAAMALATILVALSLLRRVSYQQRSARALAQEAGSRGAHRLLGDLERLQRQQYKRLVKRLKEQTREVEALLELYAGVTPRAPMPPSGLTALSPSALLDLWNIIRQKKPRMVLELGSGTSTVWVGYALAEYGGRLVSIEHDPTYAEITRSHVRRHGLETHVEVRDAPLTDLSLDEGNFKWYEPKAFDDVDGVDLLIVDGPPGGTCPYARLPALPMLEERLADQATVILDDARRPDEQTIIETWQGSVKSLVREPSIYQRMAVMAYTRVAP